MNKRLLHLTTWKSMLTSAKDSSSSSQSRLLHCSDNSRLYFESFSQWIISSVPQKHFFMHGL